MDNEKLPLLRELCFIASSRNKLNTARKRALWKKQYWKDAVKVVEAHLKSNYELRDIEAKIKCFSQPYIYDSNMGEMNGYKLRPLKARKNQILKNMAFLRSKFPTPTKWLAMGLHKLRSLTLQYEGEYATIRHQTMEMTIQTRSRVKFLLKELKGKMHYANGFVSSLTIEGKYLMDKDTDTYAKEHELEIGVQTMLSKP